MGSVRIRRNQIAAGLVLIFLLAVTWAPGAASYSAQAIVPLNRGLDLNDLTVTYYDDFNFTDFVLSEPWTAPIDFDKSCFGDPFPYEACKLHPALEEGGNYSTIWQGTLILPVDGDYTFRFSDVDDEADLLLKLNGAFTVVMEVGGAAPNPAPPVTVSLTGPIVEFRVEYKQFIPAAGKLSFLWQGPGFLEEIVPVYTAYDCPDPSTVLSDIGQAVYAEVQPQNFCQNSIDDLLILPPGKDAFERFATLATYARFSVDFTTMNWDPDRSDPQNDLVDSPAEFFLEGIADLYSIMQAIPSQFPQGMEVRLLIGLEHNSLFGTGEDQRRPVLDELREMGIPLLDESIGWRVQVASFRHSNPSPTTSCGVIPGCPSDLLNTNHSHAKLMVVDGSIAVSSGYNPEHIYLDLSESSEGTDEPMHDMGLQVSGPIGADVHAAFAELWRGARGLCDPAGSGIVLVPANVSTCSEYVVEIVQPLVISGSGSDFVFSLLRDGDPDQDGRFPDIEADNAIVAAITNADSGVNMLTAHWLMSFAPIPPMPYTQAIIDSIAQNDTNVRILLSAKPEIAPANMLSHWFMKQRLANESLTYLDNFHGRLFVQGGDGGLHSKAFSADGQLTLVGSHDLTFGSWYRSNPPFVDPSGIDIAEYSIAIDSSVATAEFDQYFEDQWIDAAPIKLVNPNIQEVFDDADDGSFIFVPPGIYAGAIVDRPMSIVGAGPEETFIDCDGEDTGFLVTSPLVTISNLRIRNCDIGIEIADQGEESPEGVSIRNVLFEEMGDIGVKLDIQSDEVFFDIENNTFYGGFVGIEISVRDPADDPSNIRNNIFQGQIDFPVSIFDGDGDLVDYSYNLFDDCGFGDCDIEWLFGSVGSGSTVHDNLFDIDPLMIYPFGGIFRLDFDSPARDASDPAMLENLKDSEAYYLVFDGDGDGFPGLDLGAFEAEMAGANRRPVAFAGGAYEADEGSPIVFDGAFSEELDGEQLEYIWSFDGDLIWDTLSSTDPTAQFTFTDDFDGFANLQVSDPNGATDSDSAFVTVFNVDPTVVGGADIVASIGEEIQFQGSFSDPGVDDTHTIEWDFDDTNTSSGSLDPTHAYTSPGSFTVTLTVTDDDGGVGIDTLIVEVTAASAIFLVIDEDGISSGSAPNLFSDDDVNVAIAEIGVRTQLAFFAQNVDNVITLHSGEVGDEGWFAIKTIPVEWQAAGPTVNGLRNFVGEPSQPFPHNVGPGLGTADANGDREALLADVPDVTPLRATGLKLLEGLRVCAVVQNGDVSINYGPQTGSLKGANLGTVAFEVLSVTQLIGGSSSALPEVSLRIIDADTVCEGQLDLFADAPELFSASEPVDVEP